jgi:hypothetical protein
MMTIPVNAVPSQSMSVVLAGQNCQIDLYQQSTGLYLDLYVSGSPIVQAMICRDRVNMIRQAYLGFIGGLAICDTQGVSDPDYTGLGSRFLLIYLEASDL